MVDCGELMVACVVVKKCARTSLRCLSGGLAGRTRRRPVDFCCIARPARTPWLRRVDSPPAWLRGPCRGTSPRTLRVAPRQLQLLPEAAPTSGREMRCRPRDASSHKRVLPGRSGARQRTPPRPHRPGRAITRCSRTANFPVHARSLRGRYLPLRRDGLGPPLWR